MPRKPRAPATDAPPTAEAIAEATSGTLTEQFSDEEIMEKIKAEQARRASQPSAPRVTIQDVYGQSVALISSALGYRTAKLRSEQSAIKVFELTLMWALNNRQPGADANLLPAEEWGSGVEEPGTPETETGPTPNETIEAAPDAAPESE